MNNWRAQSGLDQSEPYYQSIHPAMHVALLLVIERVYRWFSVLGEYNAHYLP